MATKTNSGHTQNVSKWGSAVHIGTSTNRAPLEGSFCTMDAGYYPTKVEITNVYKFGRTNDSGGYRCRLTKANGSSGITLKSASSCAKINTGSTDGGTDIAPFTYNLTASDITSAKANLMGIEIGIAPHSDGTADLYWRGNYDWVITSSNNYNITKNAGSNGSLSGVSNADYNTTVTITATPDSGFRLKTLTTNGGSNVSQSGNSITFKMPAADVTVNATFERVSTVKYYDGSAWQECDIYYYDGTDWQEVIPYWYDGSNWQECTNAT